MAYHYTAIGDSLTTGAGTLLSGGFVPIYRRMAERHLRTPVSYENLGINGLTSQELLSMVRNNPLFRSALSRAELITVTIGGNDLRPYISALAGGSGLSGSSIPQALNHTKEHVRQIVHALYQIKSGQREPFIIRMVGLYNPFPGVRGREYMCASITRFSIHWADQITGWRTFIPHLRAMNGHCFR
uniref:GDSL-type esterase/lipase family protein n=1 Tax=Paenibacillus polymyxa TaxID=1406 RepID=A0AAE9IEM7_PAEPO